MNTTQHDPLKRMTDVLATIQLIVERDFSSLLEQHPRLVRLCLNEAEALAWETGIPQLTLPTLALEKVQSVARWNARQELIRRNEPLLEPALAFAA
jgi:hypothetical protein